MIKLVIFDLDGTLVNAYPAVSQSVNYTLNFWVLLPAPTLRSSAVSAAVTAS